MYQATRVEPVAGDLSEDEEASLVEERDRTLRTALDQIQQRRRAPARPPSPPSTVVVAQHQYKDCDDSSDVAVESESTTVVKPPSSQNPLEALRQREWLLNLQEQQELQSLKVDLSSPVQQELALEEEHLLFNGEVPPLLPAQPDPPATSTTTVGSTPSTTTTCSTTSSSHSTCTTSSATCSTNSTRPGANRGSVGIKGRGSNRSRPPCVHRGNRGRPINRREQHSQQGGRSSQEHRQQGRDNQRQQGRDNYVQQGRENHVQHGRENHVQHGRENHVHQTSQAPSEQGRANSPKKTTEPPGWKQNAVPLSVQDEAAMLAQAIELSHLDDGAASKVEEEQLRIVLEQSRQEARRRGGGNSRRGAPRFPRRGWGGPGRGGGAEHCQQIKPSPPPPPVPPKLLNGITIVGSIDAGRLTSGGMPPPLHHTPPPPPPSSVNAEPTVTFDQWLSLCSRYMPLLAQGMVELQRTCAAVRSAAPSLEGASLLLPPPLWSSRFPPSATQSHMSSMGPPPMTASINSPISAPTAPHSMVPPPMAPPSMTAPSMAPPSMTAPSMAPPSVAPPPVALPSMAPPSVTPPSMAPPSMAPPPIGPSHMASGDGELFSAAATAFQCLHKPVQPPKAVLGAGHGAGLHQKNLLHHHLHLSAAHFVGKKQHQHSNEQIRVGGQALGDAGHHLLQNSMQQHPHHQAPVAANVGRLQQHPEQAQGSERGSDDAGHRQQEKPVQLQSPAADTGSKPHSSEQPHAPCRGRAHTKRRTKGGKPPCS